MALYRSVTDQRHGATAIECAFVLPAAFFLMLALVVGVAGVFRYQECAMLAREGARYASTHGYQFRKDSSQAIGASSDWQTDIINNAIKPKITALDWSRVKVDVIWPDVINQVGKPDNWPGSKVDVTVTYEWIPGFFITSPLYLKSTSSMPITN